MPSQLSGNPPWNVGRAHTSDLFTICQLINNSIMNHLESYHHQEKKPNSFHRLSFDYPSWWSLKVGWKLHKGNLFTLKSCCVVKVYPAWRRQGRTRSLAWLPILHLAVTCVDIQSMAIKSNCKNDIDSCAILSLYTHLMLSTLPLTIALFRNAPGTSVKGRINHIHIQYLISFNVYLWICSKVSISSWSSKKLL